MAHLYKSRLQNYAQKRSIPLPTFSHETQGPPHARLFKASVTIDGVTFEGLEFCTTLQNAEQEAARVAFMSLSLVEPQEEDCLYKSLLQELTQKKGLLLPAYTTNRNGPPHMPSFVSNVHIADESFVGQEARTKKQAEMNAAKVAYTALIQDRPRVNIAAVSANVARVGTSNMPTVVTDKKERNCKSSTGKMQTSTKNGEGEAHEKHILTLEPLVIHESQPNVMPNVVNTTQLNSRRRNCLTQGGQTHEDTGPESNKTRNPSSFATDGAPNSVMDSSNVGSPQTKIVICPHEPGMIDEGPIQCADDEWIAMIVNMMMEDSPDDAFASDVFS